MTEELEKTITKGFEEVKTNIEKSIDEKLKPLATVEQVKALENDLNEFAVKMQKGSSGVNELHVELKENKDKLKAIAGGANEEIILKAISNRASVVGNAQAFDLPDIGQLPTRKLSLYDLFPKVQVSESNNNGTIRYYDWDIATTIRASASLAEGGTFAESTAKFQVGTLTIEKIGDSLPVTEEFFEDEAMFANELDLFLATNVNLVIDDQLCNGTGTSNQLKGLYTSAPAFTAVASAITDASHYDLIVKVAEDIITTGGAKYMPDTVIMRRSEINKMKLKKDVNKQYVIPPFVSANGKEVDGMQVIESNVAPTNTLIVCDRRFAKIYEKTGVTISKGYIASQFVQDAMTLKARKRLAFLIRNADLSGFRKVASISASLVTLAT